jgi:hypothetical protein
MQGWSVKAVLVSLLAAGQAALAQPPVPISDDPIDDTLRVMAESAQADLLSDIDAMGDAPPLPTAAELLEEAAALAMQDIQPVLDAGRDVNGQVGGIFGYHFLPEFLPLIAAEDRRVWIERFFDVSDLDTRADSLTWLRGQEGAVRLAENGLQDEAVFMLERAADYIGGPGNDPGLMDQHLANLAQGWIAIGAYERAAAVLDTLITLDQESGRLPELTADQRAALLWDWLYRNGPDEVDEDIQALTETHQDFLTRLADARTADFRHSRREPLPPDAADGTLSADIPIALAMGEADAARYWTQRLRIHHLNHSSDPDWRTQAWFEAETGDCFAASRAANLMVLEAFDDVARSDLERGERFVTRQDHNGHSNWPDYMGRPFDWALLALMECGAVAEAANLAMLPGLSRIPFDRVLSTRHRRPLDDMWRLQFRSVFMPSIRQRNLMGRALACHVLALAHSQHDMVELLVGSADLVTNGLYADTDEMRIRLAEGLRAEGLGGLEAHILERSVRRLRTAPPANRYGTTAAQHLEQATALARLAYALPDTPLPAAAPPSVSCGHRDWVADPR